MVLFETVNCSVSQQELELTKGDQFITEFHKCNDQYIAALKQPDLKLRQSILLDLLKNFEADATSHYILAGYQGQYTVEDQVMATQLLSYIYRNLAMIYESEETQQLQQDPQPDTRRHELASTSQAVVYYRKSISVQVDASDVQIWLQLGQLYHRYHNLKLARRSFEMALTKTPSGLNSPWQWKALTNLIEVLYDIGDTHTCLSYVNQALKLHPKFPRGIKLHQILTSPNLAELSSDSKLDRKRKLEPLVTTLAKRPVVINKIVLNDHDWVSLGSELLAAYKEELKEAKNRPLSTLPQRIIQVVFEKSPEVEFVDEKVSSNPTTPKLNKKKPLPPPTRSTRTRSGASREDPDLVSTSNSRNMTVFYESVAELFESKGYDSPTKPKTPIAFLAATTQGIEDAIKDFALRLRNKNPQEYRPIHSSHWAREYLALRKTHTLSKKGTSSGLQSPPTESIDMSVDVDTFIRDLNGANMIAADWLLEYLLKLFGDPTSSEEPTNFWLKGRWPQSLLRVSIGILVSLLPSLLPGFPLAAFPVRARFAWLVSICELVLASKKWETGTLTKTSSAANILACPTSLKLWMSHLETERHYWMQPIDDDLNIRYWWIVAAFNANTDPQQELRALKQAADLIIKLKTEADDEHYCVNLPNCIYGLRISSETIEEKRVKAEIRCENAHSHSDIEYSPDYLLPHIRVMNQRLDTGNSKESSHLKLASHILKCKIRASIIALEIRLCDLFSDIAEFCHLKDNSVFKSTSSTFNNAVNIKPSAESYINLIRDNFEAISNVIESISPHFYRSTRSKHHFVTILTKDQIKSYYQIARVIIHLMGALMKLSDTFLTHPKTMDVCQLFLIKGLELFLQCILRLPTLSSVKSFAKDDLLFSNLNDFIFLMHNELGKLKLCELDAGCLPRYLLFTLKSLKNTKCQEDINQCITCLYHLSINKQQLYKEEHTSYAQPLTLTAVGHVYDALWSTIKAKTCKGSNIHPPHKTVLDTLCRFLLREEFLSAAGFSYNRRVIDAYLDQPMNFTNLVSNLKGDSLTTFGEVGNQCTKLPKLYSQIFLAFGRVQLNQVQYKLNNLSTIVEVDLEAIIETLKVHLSICSHSFEGWYFLGCTFDVLVGGLLCRTEFKAHSEYVHIAQYQKQGLFCFAEAARILNQWPTYPLDKSIPMEEFWTSFGKLVYTSASKPMNSIVYQPDLTETLKLVPVEPFRMVYQPITVDAPPQQDIHRFAVHLFHRALNFNIEKWEPYMMLAKCFHKLDVTPVEAFVFLERSIHFSKDVEKKTLLEPRYQMISLLYKHLSRNSITPAEVSKWIVACRLNCDTTVNTVPADATDLSTADIDHDKAIVILLKALETLKALDRDYHHRNIYRTAYIQFHESKKIDTVMEEMEKLVNIRKSVTSFVHVWKPPFERPGKHFVYVSQYIAFMYQLIVGKVDPDFAAQFLRRVHKISDRIYDYDSIWYQGIVIYVKEVRRHFNVQPRHLVGKPCSGDQFRRATIQPRQLAVTFLCTKSSETVDVEYESSRLLLREMKVILELYKLDPSSPKSQTLLLTILGDVYVTFLEIFDFQEPSSHPTESTPTVLTKKEVFKSVEMFIREVNNQLKSAFTA